MVGVGCELGFRFQGPGLGGGGDDGLGGGGGAEVMLDWSVVGRVAFGLGGAGGCGDRER